MIEILDMKDVKDATPEELEELRRKGFLLKTRSKRISGKPLSQYERTRAQVAATGNRWAMENFYATHSGKEIFMGMYHKNHLVGPGFKRRAKRQTSKGMRRAVKKSCREHFEDSVTLTRKSHNLHGIDSWKFS